MSIQDQKELIQLITDYNNTDPTIIRKNIVKYIDMSGLEIPDVAEKAGIKLITLYEYRQFKKRHSIAFEIALRLVDVLNINIAQLVEQY